MLLSRKGFYDMKENGDWLSAADKKRGMRPGRHPVEVGTHDCEVELEDEGSAAKESQNRSVCSRYNPVC